MSKQQDEVTRRTTKAKAALQQELIDGGEESSVALFVSHHIEELNEAYWTQHTGTKMPTPQSVLNLLELRSHWSGDDEEGLDTFDFTLPGEVTDYILAVKFDADGDVESVDMES